MGTQLITIPSSERLRKSKSLIPSVAELETLGVVVWDDHFMGDQMRYDATAPGTYQTAINGTAAAAAAINTGAANGSIILDAGTDDNGYSGISLGRHFYGQNYAHIWWKFQLSAVSSVKGEWGFTDVVAGTDAGAVNDKSTPTFNATDAVVIILDTDHNASLSLCAVKNGTAETTINFNQSLSGATYYYAGIELNGDRAKGYLLNAGGELLDQTAWMDDAVSADVLLTPWAFVQCRAGSTNRTMLIDRLKAYQWEVAQ